LSEKRPRNFTWAIGHPLPAVEAHSDRKLTVIEQYLNVYFDTVVRDPRMDNLNITLVDGFCGGGRYRTDTGERPGSPLVILSAVFEAKIRLNQGRHKPLSIDAVCHFGDEDRAHIEFLRETIKTGPFSETLGRTTHLHHAAFVDLLPSIIADIKRRQVKGRAIFVLDQFGYSDVPMDAIRTIFDCLPKAEVILTFSIDALLNYLQEEGRPSAVVEQFGVNEAFLRRWQDWKQGQKGGRAMAQRVLMAQMHRYSGARFFTPFMMFSNGDSRQMMVAHLSQSQAARDKMLSVHWAVKNTFKHIGKGSLFELGFDERVEFETSLFEFTDADRSNMRKELSEELPKQIYDVSGGGPLSFGELLLNFGNKTAATNADVMASLQHLAAEGEIEILKPNGGFKRPNALIKVDDHLRLPRQMRLFRV
jgi:three-Cys-motif partner protein